MKADNYLTLWIHEDNSDDLTDIVHKEIVSQNVCEAQVYLGAIVNYYSCNANYERFYGKFGDSNDFHSVAGSIKMLAKVTTMAICKICNLDILGNITSQVIVEIIDEAVANYINIRSLEKIDKYIFLKAKETFGSNIFTVEDIISILVEGECEDFNYVQLIKFGVNKNVIKDCINESNINNSLKSLCEGKYFDDKGNDRYCIGEAVLDLRCAILDAVKNILPEVFYGNIEDILTKCEFERE